MYMSVQIQFHIIDKFIKFSPDVTSVLKSITKALGILHGNLFRIYEGFSIRKPFLFPLFILTPKFQQLKIIKITECSGWGL
jgi:hypothetical protein